MSVQIDPSQSFEPGGKGAGQPGLGRKCLFSPEKHPVVGIFCYLGLAQEGSSGKYKH